VQHVPVLLQEAIEYLAPERGGIFVDCTLGLGGHAQAVLQKGSGARLIGIDRDPNAIELAAERLAPFGERARLVEGEFWNVRRLLADLGIERVSGGILADLGVSSMQLDTAPRGFSFQRDGPLDMRMGAGETTAADIVNEFPEGELVRIFREYGEERRARRIARAIVERRHEQPLGTTGELRDLVGRVSRPQRGPRGRRIDPATRVFQALRIAVNRELSGLEDLLDQAIDLLDQDGRLVVISYHSLEDRIVKHTLRDLARGEVDQVTGRTRSETRVIELLTGKPVRPRSEEVAANPRSRSARLRAARRI
jgi:16S rRNA (cytosine1402-N4)-methyltransferase